MKFALLIFMILLFTCSLKSFCQTSITDSSMVKGHTILFNEKRYNVGNGKIFVYTKPKPLSFLTNLPKYFAGIGKAPFKKMR